MKLNDVGIIITTFIRDDVLYPCVESIREFYPDIRIYVIDQGKTSYKKEYFLKNHHCDYIRIPYDSGLALSRNLGMYASKEKYMVICDDDFRFTKETKLENWRELMEARSSVGVAAGCLFTNGQEWHYEHELRKHKKFYIMKELDRIDWKTHKGIKYHYCDLVLNWLMIRRECWNDCPWDSEYKIVHEHLQFFLDLKDQGKWKVLYTPTVSADHERKPHCDEYEVLRGSRGRKRLSWLHYYRKTGIRFGIYLTKAEGGLKVIDLYTGEMVSNHHLFLNKIYGGAPDSPVQKIYAAIAKEIESLLPDEKKKEIKILTEEQKKLQQIKDEFWKKRTESRSPQVDA